MDVYKCIPNKFPISKLTKVNIKNIISSVSSSHTWIPFIAYGRIPSLVDFNMPLNFYSFCCYFIYNERQNYLRWSHLTFRNELLLIILFIVLSITSMKYHWHKHFMDQLEFMMWLNKQLFIMDTNHWKMNFF